MAGGQALFPGKGLGETFSHKQLFTEGRAVNKFLVVKIYFFPHFLNEVTRSGRFKSTGRDYKR